MATLSREQRKLLESTVVAARGVAERGAGKALTALGVGDRRPPESLSDAEKSLRRKLRAHGHQLGDMAKNDEQETTHLKQACAYEHWHRMLFARFLAENDLLLNPEYGVAMSLAEIQETARAQNQDWLSLASDYAQRMLLEVFRPDDPVLQVVIPPETRQELEASLAELPTEVFTADDSLGWVYQFWQRDEKERVNKSEVKIGADELSPVTQLFTEDYMVLFLLHNTLGAWWAAKRRAEGKTHELPGYDWTYLRLNDDGSPAAGNFDGWPKTARELRVLDPCMGSGHFLTFALPILARMRQDEEGLSISEAVHATLAENLFGLELDARCSQIAAFNLALTAWRMVGRPMQLPAMNLACSGLGINASQDSWVALAGDNRLLRDTLAELYSIFQKAPILGSLIDPTRVGRPLLIAKFEEVWPLLERALTAERQSDESWELAIAAKGVLSAARMLAEKFTLVSTNVPYLGRGKQHEYLRDYCDEYYPEAKADLATCFIVRCLRLCMPEGTIAIVSPQNWFFLPGYATVRKQLLRDAQFNVAVRLGANAFQDMNFWAATTAMCIISAAVPETSHSFLGVDASQSKEQDHKKAVLRGAEGDLAHLVDQASQLANPDSRISMEPPSQQVPLNRIAITPQGLKTGDDSRFRRNWWEIDFTADGWRFLQGAPDTTRLVDGCSFALDFRSGDSAFARPQGQAAWGKQGIVVKLMGEITVARYFGQVFDSNVTALVPANSKDLVALWAYMSSGEFATAIRSIEQSVKVNNATVGKVGFDAARWREITDERFSGELPWPDSEDPTQWLFSGHPCRSDHPLQAAVGRLLGFRWPRQRGLDFSDCPSIAADGLEGHADQDGIVCFSSLSGEASAPERLRALLVDTYGPKWSAAKLTELIGDSDSLETWLRDRFFEEHCSLFHGRPFVWHVWDGRKDGFHALVNYHKLAGPNGEGRKTLEKLIYTSLGDWISRQRAEVKGGMDGAEGRLAAAEHLKAELTNIVNGEPPYDLFIRWKPLHEQPMGWEPDLNDGIRLNMRPWLHARPYQEPNQKLKQGACILRVTPIKLPLGKDRGKEPLRDKEDFPWFATSPDRTNDEHFTLEQKRAARERKKKA